jgi:hypothetical protein
MLVLADMHTPGSAPSALTAAAAGGAHTGHPRVAETELP